MTVANSLSRILLALVVGVTPRIAYAQTAAPAPPLAAPVKSLGSAGLAAERIARIDRVLEDYVEKNAFEEIVVGVSGGIDSALTAAIACVRDSEMKKSMSWNCTASAP